MFVEVGKGHIALLLFFSCHRGTPPCLEPGCPEVAGHLHGGAEGGDPHPQMERTARLRARASCWGDLPGILHAFHTLFPGFPVQGMAYWGLFLTHPSLKHLLSAY